MNQLPRNTDVLIVGAGPVGLTVGAALRAQGVAVVIVDRAPQPPTTSRAAVIHARTLQKLETVGVTEELVRRGVIVPRFSLRDRDRTLVNVDFDGLPTEHPYTVMLPQDQTEAILRSRLEELGEEVHRGYELAHIDQDDEGVTATMAGGEMVSAAYVVGADGMHSAVREQCGIGFSGEAYGQSFVLADVRLDWEFADSEVMLYFAPAGLVVIAPLPEGRYRIVATTDEAPEHPDSAFVQALLDERGPEQRPAVVEEVVWSSRFRVHHRLADQYRAGRVFLAGDAAHVHSPAGGQGMNTGIQDAVALAGRLVGVMREGAEAGTLDSYETERRPVAAGVLSLTHRMTRMATVEHRLPRRLRNLALSVFGRIPAVRRRMAMNLSGLALEA